MATCPECALCGNPMRPTNGYCVCTTEGCPARGRKVVNTAKKQGFEKALTKRG